MASIIPHPVNDFLTLDMIKFLEDLELKSIKQTLTIFYGTGSNGKKTFMKILKKYKTVVDLLPHSVRYEYAMISQPSTPDIILINYPNKKDLYTHISLESLDIMRMLGVPIIIITNFLPHDILNQTSPVLMFHKIRIIHFNNHYDNSIDVDKIINDMSVEIIKDKCKM